MKQRTLEGRPKSWPAAVVFMRLLNGSFIRPDGSAKPRSCSLTDALLPAIPPAPLPSLLTANLILLGTLVLAVLGWFIAFIGQIVAEADNGSQPLGRIWFGIFLQFFLNAGVIITIATDSIGMARLQVAAFTAVALTFSVVGIDEGIYDSRSSYKAFTAGYFLTTFADVIWLLYFTSEEDSPIFALMNTFGTGGLNGPGSRATRGGGARRTSMRMGAGGMGMGNGNAYAGSFQGGPPGGAYQQAYGNSPSAADVTSAGAGMGGGVLGVPKLSTSASIRSANQGAPTGPGSEYGAAPSTHPPGSPSPSAGRGGAPLDGEGKEALPDYGYRARALYACECFVLGSPCT